MIKENLISKRFKKSSRNPSLIKIGELYAILDGFIGFVVSEDYLKSKGFMDFAGNIRPDIKVLNALHAFKSINISPDLTTDKDGIFKASSTGILCETENKCVRLLEFEGQNIICADVELLEHFQGCEIYATSTEGIILAYKNNKLEGFCVPVRFKPIQEIIEKNRTILEKTS